MSKPEKKPANKSRQLPLALPVEASTAREDLLVSPANERAVRLIDDWPDWPISVAVIAGPTGSGKSHIGRIWAARAGALVRSMKKLPEDAGATGMLIEDAQPGAIPEEALFHAFNRARETGSSILVTSRDFPSSWRIGLPDLVSRLKTVHVVELNEPDDPLLAGAIVKLLADRQVAIDPATVNYLINRMERSLEAAGRIVDWLDREALARKRPITRPLAAEALRAFSMI